MSAMVPVTKEERAEGKTTNLGRFLAKRGVLLIKEMREISPVKGDYGDRVNISTLILSSAQSQRGDVQYGIKFEHIDADGNTRGSGFLDYDEITEVIGAFDFVDGVARKMLGALTH